MNQRFQIAKTLRETLPSVPIVVLTMYEGVAEKMLGNGLGAFGISDVISKSTELNSLVQRVEKVLSASRTAQVPRPDSDKSVNVEYLDKKTVSVKRQMALFPPENVASTRPRIRDAGRRLFINENGIPLGVRF